MVFSGYVNTTLRLIMTLICFHSCVRVVFSIGCHSKGYTHDDDKMSSRPLMTGICYDIITSNATSHVLICEPADLYVQLYSLLPVRCYSGDQ